MSNHEFQRWGLSLLIAGTLISGCVSTQRRTVHITGTPRGAMVKVDGKEIGQTPLDTTVLFEGRDSRVLIEISKERYRAVKKAHHQDDPLDVEYELEPERPVVIQE